MSIKNYIDQHPSIKQVVHWMLIPRGQARPRRWVSWFVNPFIHQRHRTSAVRSTARLDVLPFKKFALGVNSTVEDFCVVNNGVGDVLIGDHTLVGIGSVVIG